MEPATLGIDPLSIFTLLAELAIGLAGFGGVAAAFGGRDRAYGPVELDRLRVLFLHAFIALAISLAAMAFFAFGFDPDVAVQRATVLGVLSQGLAIPYYYFLAWKNFRNPETTTGLLPMIFVVGGTTAALVSFVVGLSSGGSLGWLVTGIAAQLLFGLWLFTRMLLHRN